MKNPENKNPEQQNKTLGDDVENAEGGRSVKIFILFDMIALILIAVVIAFVVLKKPQKTPEYQYQSNLLADNSQMMEFVNAMIQQEKQKESQKRFDHAVFLGDSLTEGISLYNYAKTGNVVAKKGLSIEKAMKKVNTIAKKKPQCVFIMLGINDLNYASYSMDDVEKNYKKLVKKLHKKLPDTKIYIQSLLPVTDKFQKAHKRLTNKRIDKMNHRLKKLGESCDYAIYLDINSLYRNKKGVLPKSFSSDGYHLKAECYTTWIDYLKSQI